MGVWRMESDVFVLFWHRLWWRPRLLWERIKHLEDLVEEKERLIKVYEKIMEGKK